MDFTNKTILITGASSGIGKALAQKLLMTECTLILIARRANLINAYVSQIEDKRAKVFALECDVSKKEEVLGSMIKIKHEIKVDVDIAILNAATSYRIDIKEFYSKHADEIFNVNVFGIVYWVEQLLPEFMKYKRGVIVGVSSLADSRGHAKSQFYCASKAAVTRILEGLRVELYPYNIKVITVKPGFVRTPLTSKNKFHMPMLMEPQEAADIILKGIEKEKPIIAFPLPIVFASWIGGILPSRVYEFFAKRVKVR